MSQRIGIPLSDFKQNLSTLVLTDAAYNQRFFDRALQSAIESHRVRQSQ